MSDQRGKSGEPNRPTFRPKARDVASRPTDPAPARGKAKEDEEIRTEALNIGDLEQVGSLIDSAEQGLGKVQQVLPESGRSPSKPPRLLPTIGEFGPYSIVGRLALGGMAEILLAREDAEGAGSRYLVVKRILAEFEKEDAFVEMFLDEARVMMRLKHPNVTHVYKFGKQDGTHFIAMEWVNGVSLGKVIRRARKTGGVPVHIACKFIAMVAEALDHAHDARAADGEPLGIVHRDVTPGNIMISYDGAVKLLDFGIAKAATRSHKTQAGVVKGKFAYMAPEQCRAKELDRRVDVFAMGICLYEILTGRPLYRRETEFESMEAIVRGPIPKLSDRIEDPPKELEEIIARCLAKKPEQRYETAGDLQDALDRFVASRGKIVNARRIKDMMGKLFHDELNRGPTVDTTPFGSSFHMGSDAAAAFSLETGNGEALEGDSGVDIPSLESEAPPAMAKSASLPPVPATGAPSAPPMMEAVATPPYEGGAGLELDDRALRPAAAQRRPAATAPARPPRPSAPEKSGNLTTIIVGVLALGGLAAGAWFAFPYVVPAEPVVEPTEAPVLTGSLTIASEPAGATLYVDGTERGVTPTTVGDLYTGQHRVRLALDGYRTHDGMVDVGAGETTEVTQPLEAIGEEDAEPVGRGRLTLTTTPTATVFLNGRELGETPLRDIEMPAGLIALELRTPDGEQHRRGVMVPVDDATATHIDLRDN